MFCLLCGAEKLSYQLFRAFPLGTVRIKGQQCCHLDKFLILLEPVFAEQAAKEDKTDINLNFRIPKLQKLNRN